MNVELSRRLARAVNGVPADQVTAEERISIADAYMTADRFSDLPADVQRLVRRLEKAAE